METKTALSYGFIAFAISLLHSVFVSFYIDYYFRVRKLDLTLFAIGQVFYAIWNALNDFVFGWLNDTKFASLLSRRSTQIRLGGPLWAGAFVILWLPLEVPFLNPSVQYTAMMVIYDGLFSYTTVAFRALLPDIARSSLDREKCNATAAVFHLVGAAAVGFAGYFYESVEEVGLHHHSPSSSLDAPVDPLYHFRLFTCFLGILSALSFIVTTSSVKENPYSSGEVEAVTQLSPMAFARDVFRRDREERGKKGEANHYSPTKGRDRTIPWLMLVWGLQEYSCSFATNFFTLFLSIGTSTHLLRSTRSALLVLSFAVPHLLTVSVTPLLQRWGRKPVVSAFLGIRAVVSAVALMQWKNGTAATGSYFHAWSFALFLLLGRVLTEGVCRLQPLIAADAIDEDTLIHQRAVPMGGAVHGLLALAAKPFQSVAPLVTCAFLVSSRVLTPEGHSSAALENGNEGQQLSRSAYSSSAVLSIQWIFAATGCLTSLSLLLVWTQKYHITRAVAKEIEKKLARYGSSAEV